jgi:hypothetical protein
VAQPPRAGDDGRRSGDIVEMQGREIEIVSVQNK